MILLAIMCLKVAQRGRNGVLQGQSPKTMDNCPRNEANNWYIYQECTFHNTVLDLYNINIDGCEIRDCNFNFDDNNPAYAIQFQSPVNLKITNCNFEKTGTRTVIYVFNFYTMNNANNNNNYDNVPAKTIDFDRLYFTGWKTDGEPFLNLDFSNYIFTFSNSIFKKNTGKFEFSKGNMNRINFINITIEENNGRFFIKTNNVFPIIIKDFFSKNSTNKIGNSYDYDKYFEITADSPIQITNFCSENDNGYIRFNSNINVSLNNYRSTKLQNSYDSLAEFGTKEISITDSYFDGNNKANQLCKLSDWDFLSTITIENCQFEHSTNSALNFYTTKNDVFVVTISGSEFRNFNNNELILINKSNDQINKISMFNCQFSSITAKYLIHNFKFNNIHSLVFKKCDIDIIFSLEPEITEIFNMTFAESPKLFTIDPSNDNLKLHKCNFISNSQMGLFPQKKNMYFVDCILELNQPKEGNAVIELNDVVSKLEILNCQFNNNIATTVVNFKSLNDLTINNSIIYTQQQNLNSNYISGVITSNLLIYDSNFSGDINSTVLVKTNGAIISNSNFTNIFESQHGSLVFIESTGSTKIENCVFNYIQTAQSPAVKVLNAGELLIDGNTFCVDSRLEEIKETSIIVNSATFSQNSFSGKYNEVSNLPIGNTNYFDIDDCFFIIKEYESSIALDKMSSEQVIEIQSSETLEIDRTSEVTTLFTSTEECQTSTIIETTTAKQDIYYSSEKTQEFETSTIMNDLSSTIYIESSVLGFTTAILDNQESSKYFDSSTLDIRISTTNQDSLKQSSDAFQIFESSTIVGETSTNKLLTSTFEFDAATSSHGLIASSTIFDPTIDILYLSKSESVIKSEVTLVYSSEYDNEMVKSENSENLIINDEDDKSKMTTIIAGTVAAVVIVIIIIIVVVIIVRKKGTKESDELAPESELETIVSSSPSTFMTTQAPVTFGSPFTQTSAMNDDDPFREDDYLEDRAEYVL